MRVRQRYWRLGGWTTALLLLLVLTACGREAADSAPSSSHAESAVSPKTSPSMRASSTIEASEAPEDTELPVASINVENSPDSLEAEPAPLRKKENLPEGFVYIDEIVPDARFEIRYYTDYNFVGAKIDGYKAPVPIMTAKAAEALKEANEEFKRSGYAVLVYDAYRPKKAVEHFIRWAGDPKDTAMKEVFYPDVDKTKVFKLGYVASKSGHSRGSTVDLTIADRVTGLPADMGSPYDFFGEVSSHGTKQITDEQAAMRDLLKKVMVKHGFKPYNKEWWHYTLKDEPYPKEYFDFDVE